MSNPLPSHKMVGPLRVLRTNQSTAKLIPAIQAYGGIQAPAVRTHNQTQTMGRFGSFEVRLAQSAAEVRQAQKLRYQVFYEKGPAIATTARLFARRDFDSYDTICDHLLVLDHADSAASDRQVVVGTCRLLRQTLAETYTGFYSGREFDIGPLLARHRHLQFLELGRSCVLEPYRKKRAVELLWHGIHAYVQQNRCDVMIGCASIEGIDPKRLALPLSLLHHYFRAPALWQARAWPARHVNMNWIAKESIDPNEGLRVLPPLIRGYLRLGAHIGDGAVIDREFGTTDVLVVLPLSVIHKRYFAHFEMSRRAA